MNNFPWTDEMVKEVCALSASLVSYDHTSSKYDSNLDTFLEKYKQEKLPTLTGTSDRKVYWAVNRKSLNIAPISHLTDEENDRAYFSTYDEALKFISLITTAREVNKVLPG